LKQLEEIIKFYESFPEQERDFAIALVYQTNGSTYRKAGARMLVHISGEYAGGISGGCLESHLQKKAKLNLIMKRNEIITYDTSQKHGAGSNLGCDGNIAVLVNPIDPKSEFNTINALKKVAKRRTDSIIITIISSTDPTFKDDIGNSFSQEEITQKWSSLSKNNVFDFTQFFTHKKSETILFENDSTQTTQFFLEYISPTIRLVLVGHQRDIFPLIAMAEILGWQIDICGRKDKYPAEILKKINFIDPDELRDTTVDSHTAVVFMSHDFDADVRNLPHIIESNAFYIGLLGPLKRKHRLLKEIGRMDLVDVIFGPIGLNIGTNSPEEIALSVCAEIQKIYSTNQMMRYKN
jgi:xanthine/CO dehydrogenase XdhC/CoxF family maturation factor